MTLGLEIAPTLKGLFLEPLVLEEGRDLVPEDLPLLDVQQPGYEKPLKRLRDRHHAAARLLAAGIMKDSEVALCVGLAPITISNLKTNRAFKDLIQFYRTQRDDEMRSNFQRLAGLTADAADLLQERIEEEPEGLSNGQLIEIVKLGADRTGLGPQSSSVTVNINANIADRMKAAREAARAASEPKEIEGEAREVERDAG